MSAATKSRWAYLRDWRNPDQDTANELHCWFQERGSEDWTDVWWDAVRVHNHMFPDERMHRQSVLSSLFAACAAQASKGAFIAMGRALGVDPEALEGVVGHWQSEDRQPPRRASSIEPSKLFALVDGYKRWCDSGCADEAWPAGLDE